MELALGMLPRPERERSNVTSRLHPKPPWSQCQAPMGLGYQAGYLPIGPMDTDSPRVGTRAAFTLQPLLPATGSGETGLSYPDQLRMAVNRRTLSRSKGHTTPGAEGGVGPGTKGMPRR